MKQTRLLVQLAVQSRALREAFERFGRMFREITEGPIAPGEVRCSLPHGFENTLTASPETLPVTDVTTRGAGCPGCGAQL